MSVSHYAQTIAEDLGVTRNEAAVIEEVLRVEHPTLDHMSRAQLAREARVSQQVLEEMRRTDPECAAWYTKCARTEDES